MFLPFRGLQNSNLVVLRDKRNHKPGNAADIREQSPPIRSDRLYYNMQEAPGSEGGGGEERRGEERRGEARWDCEKFINLHTDSKETHDIY